MLEYLALGLLMTKPLTMYEMKKMMQQSTDHFFSASFGSLHPVLNKLSEKKWVSGKEKLENGRGKKIYSITDSGKTAFLEWLKEDITPERVREASLLKLFFLGHLPEKARRLVLERYLSDIGHHLEQLRQLLEFLQDSELPKTHKDYQLATLEFGVAYYEFVLGWYKKKFVNGHLV
jgi:DNA-binding PadR family transcriptional regulator